MLKVIYKRDPSTGARVNPEARIVLIFFFEMGHAAVIQENCNYPDHVIEKLVAAKGEAVKGWVKSYESEAMAEKWKLYFNLLKVEGMLKKFSEIFAPVKNFEKAFASGGIVSECPAACNGCSQPEDRVYELLSREELETRYVQQAEEVRSENSYDGTDRTIFIMEDGRKVEAVKVSRDYRDGWRVYDPATKNVKAAEEKEVGATMPKKQFNKSYSRRAVKMLSERDPNNDRRFFVTLTMKDGREVKAITEDKEVEVFDPAVTPKASKPAEEKNPASIPTPLPAGYRNWLHFHTAIKNGRVRTEGSYAFPEGEGLKCYTTDEVAVRAADEAAAFTMDGKNGDALADFVTDGLNRFLFTTRKQQDETTKFFTDFLNAFVVGR